MIVKLSILIAAGFVSLVGFNSANASCIVAVPQAPFVYEGYEIRFDFVNMLGTHGFKQGGPSDSPDFVIEAQGTMAKGRYFRSADVSIFMRDLNTGKLVALGEKSRTCLTDYCAISDFQAAFTKAYRLFSKALPQCASDL